MPPCNRGMTLGDILQPENIVPDLKAGDRWGAIDELINRLVPPHRGRGRRITFNPAQLFRVHLLALLTPARSFNLLVRLLSEQRSWRRFAHLSHRHQVPDVWMLHQFRAAIGVGGLREVNRHLLRPLLESQWVRAQAVAVIDSTDLPAATCTR